MADNLEKEKAFTLTYHSHMKKLQAICDDDVTVYTKITLPFALLNDLCFYDLVFHPKSLGKHKSFERPDLSIEAIKKTLEEIIVYEISRSEVEGKLTFEQLELVIKSFRSLNTQKKLA